MRQKIFNWLLATFLLTTASIAEAQQSGKSPRIGFFVLYRSNDPANIAHAEAFRQGLRERGWVEGQNISVEYRFAEERQDRLTDLAAELVNFKVDVIVAQATPAIRAAKNTTRTIPIVMASSGDPVRDGLVASLARPGGNVTGLTSLSSELSGKRLELLKEVIPKLSRVAVLWNPSNPPNILALKETEVAAKAFGIKLQPLELRGPDDLESVFSAMSRRHVEALVTLPDPIIFGQRTRIVEFAARSSLVAIYQREEFVSAGGLMAYGVSFFDLFRRTAVFVDKILKGAKPADLPVEQPKKFEFVINLKTAKQIGLSMPPNVLARADKVIR